MNKPRPRMRRTRNEGGVALVEILVAMIILAAVLLGLAGATGHASRQMYYSSREMNIWSALQWQADSLRAAGFNNLSDGSAMVEGHPVSWTVTGTDPKTVTVDIQFTNRQGMSATRSVVLTFPAADTL